MRPVGAFAAGLLVLCFVSVSPARAAEREARGAREDRQNSGERWDKSWYWKDVHYVPTAEHVVHAMLDMAQVTADDVVYDLGSGDGRIVITAAARHGARAVGIDHDPRLIERSERDAREAGVVESVEFRREDLLVSDFSDATVVTMYLTPRFMKKLVPSLEAQLAPGTRVVTHQYGVPGWEPVEKVRVKRRKLYLYKIGPSTPAREE